MPRFAAIEGLRAWLAWVVVFSHIGQSLGLADHGGRSLWLARAGEAAVLVFITVSGFVIAGLVIDKQETWPRYITRRAFRIFPAFWAAYAAALFALPLAISALPYLQWIGDPQFTYDELLASWAKAMADHPWQQISLHLTLLQGVVPDSAWPFTSVAVLGPAWSLSLEWQFYLVAPVFVWLVAQDRYRMATAIGVGVLSLAFHYGLFGTFTLPSFLPGAAFVFLIGIACRLNFDRLKSAAVGPEAIPVIVLIAVMFPDALWLCIWAIVLLFLLRADAWAATPTGRRMSAVLHALFASPVATFLGARSYSVYMVHFPIIMAITSWIAPRWSLDRDGFFLALTAAVVPATLLASELLYRLVERPMIALGARLAAGPRSRPAPQAAE